MLPLGDTNPPRRAPVMTLALVLVNLAVFVYTLQLAGEGRAGAFVQAYALVPRRLLAGWGEWSEWRTILTHQFLHGGLGHVLGNCWFLWVFGRNVEGRVGPCRFLILYLVSGVAAAAVQVAVSADSPLPMMGASGAISGVLGAYLVLFPNAWIYTLVPWIVPIVPVPALVFLAVWFVVQAFNGFGALLGGSAGGVAWWAHVGGFAAGIGLLVLLRAFAGPRR